MKVRISSALLERIKSLCAADRNEICGLLLGENNWIRDIGPATNVAADPARHFELDPAVLVAAHRAARGGGPAVIGHYHSHPSGSPEPSAVDTANAAPDGSLWLIVGQGMARLWRAMPGSDGTARFVAATLDIM